MSLENGISDSLTTSVENLDLSAHVYRQKKFKIGLDYGTTYSAGAFCLASGSTRYLQCGEIHPFSAYTSEFNETKSKNTELPSDIRYEGNITKIGVDALHWASPASYSIRRAKLGLDDRPETAPARTTLMRDLARLPCKKGPVEVISDYLAELFAIFKEQLVDVGYDPRDSVELNCAVPSIWTHRARRSMVSAIQIAAQRSGLVLDPVIRLWPEAEAATEHALRQHPNLNIQRDDVFIVCDAGGGTVDFTTYEVQNQEPLCLKEVVEASGALCGSTFLDEGFCKLAETRARACPTLLQSKSESAIQKQLHNAAVKFRSFIKPGFMGLKSGNYTIPFAGLPEDMKNGFMEDEMIVESKELLPIFEGVAEEVWVNLRSQLLQAEQRQCHVKFVIFTGGLSRSPFMKARLTKGLAEECRRLGRRDEIQLVSTQTADSSVAQGAIHCSFKTGDDARTRRINCTSIGIPYSEVYESKLLRHNASGVQKSRDETDKCYYVKNVIHWVLTRGKEQPSRKSMTLYQNIPENSTDTFPISIPLYACEHACKDGYPLSYYQARSQECSIWEEVTFTIDVSVIRARLQPQVQKPRKARRQKNACRPVRPSRRSARLNGTNEMEDPDSRQIINVDAIDEAVDFNSIASETAPEETLSQELTDILEEDNDNSQKYYHVKYSFTMEFFGLLASYEFWCEDAQYSRKGTISLPDQFDFGSC